MKKKMKMIENKEGDLEGIQENYRGKGLEKMRLKEKELDKEGFEKWVEEVKEKDEEKGEDIDSESYEQMVKKREKNEVKYLKYGEKEMLKDIVKR